MTLARIPLGRWSTPKEVAPLICFLLSDAANLTGSLLTREMAFPRRAV